MIKCVGANIMMVRIVERRVFRNHLLRIAVTKVLTMHIILSPLSFLSPSSPSPFTHLPWLTSCHWPLMETHTLCPLCYINCLCTPVDIVCVCVCVYSMRENHMLKVRERESLCARVCVTAVFGLCAVIVSPAGLCSAASLHQWELTHMPHLLKKI